jgi:hypothetical protein
MRHLYTHLGEAQLALLLIGLSVGVSLGSLWLSYRFLPRLRFEENSADFGQIYGSAIGTIFSLIFALVIVADWQNYDRLSAGVSTEVNVLNNLHENLESFPAGLRIQGQAKLAAYVNRVVTVEWPLMADGQRDPGSEGLLAELTALLGWRKAVSLNELPAQAEMLRLLAEARNLRQDRIQGGAPYLDLPMWMSLGVGSVILLGFSALLNMPSRRQHYIMQGALGASIGVVLYLLLIYDTPFIGPGAITPAAMKALPEQIWVAP